MLQGRKNRSIRQRAVWAEKLAELWSAPLDRSRKTRHMRPKWGAQWNRIWMYLIIFDVDGTLLDSQNTIVHGFETAFASVGLPAPDRKAILSIVGRSLDEAFADLVGHEHEHLAAQMADAYRTEKLSRRAAGLDFDPLYPGARETIDRLHARPDVLLGIATGKAMRGVQYMMDVHDLHGRFITIQTADTSPSKPHPDMITRALSETGAAAERTVMIGDTGFDMAMARAGGVHAIGVTWGYHDHTRLVADGAERVIESFEDLEPVLNEILQIKKETV